MPSNRRLKAAGATLVLVLFTFFYLSSSSSSSNSDFYEKTVAGLEVRAQKAAAGGAAHLAPGQHVAGGGGGGSVRKVPTEDVQRPMKDTSGRAGALGEDSKAKPVAAKEGAGPLEEEERRPPQVGKDGAAPGSKKWDMGKDGEEVVDQRSEQEKQVEATLNDILKKGPIIIFSKSYCPYSKKAKHIFEQYSFTPKPYIVELDQHELGPELQDALGKITKRRTVPNILIAGTSIGGGDDIEALHNEGKLIDKIKEAGGKRIMEAKLLDSKLRRGMEK